MKAKKEKSSSKMYFNADTQTAIVAFQNATTHKEKSQIYVKDIEPAFNKLVENLINIYKFTALHDTNCDLKNDCITFLYETLTKFDPSRGTNAFSYFNIVGKNFLIIKAKNRNKFNKHVISLDDINSFTSSEKQSLDEKCCSLTLDEQIENNNQSTLILEKLYKIRDNPNLTENEQTLIKSIIYVFEHVNNIDILNKNAILLYLRELTGFAPKQLTSIMSNLRKNYALLRFSED